METLREFAEDGLRTLCLASRELTKEEVESFLKRWNEASLATQNREEKMDAVSESLEARWQSMKQAVPVCLVPESNIISSSVHLQHCKSVVR